MKLSIITPVYNTKDYLPKCLNSIWHQLGPRVELILVDDGSTDGSEKLCDDYASKLPQYISCLHKPNGGPSEARNAALKIARGDYVFFVDSDDYLEDDSLNKICDSLNSGADIYEFGFNVWKNRELIRIHKPLACPKIVDVESYLVESLKAFTYEWFPWKYVLRRDLFSDDYLFPKGLRYEDVYLLPRIMIKAKTMGSIDSIVYNYILARPGAITNGINYKSERDKLIVSSNVIEFMNKHVSGELRDLLNDSFAKMYVSALIVSQGFESKEERHAIWALLREKKGILKYILSGKQKIVAQMVKLFGLRMTSYLLYIRYKLTK